MGAAGGDSKSRGVDPLNSKSLSYSPLFLSFFLLLPLTSVQCFSFSQALSLAWTGPKQNFLWTLINLAAHYWVDAQQLFPYCTQDLDNVLGPCDCDR